MRNSFELDEVDIFHNAPCICEAKCWGVRKVESFYIEIWLYTNSSHPIFLWTSRIELMNFFKTFHLIKNHVHGLAHLHSKSWKLIGILKVVFHSRVPLKHLSSMLCQKERTKQFFFEWEIWIPLRNVKSLFRYWIYSCRYRIVLKLVDRIFLVNDNELKVLFIDQLAFPYKKILRHFKLLILMKTIVQPMNIQQQHTQ